MAGGSVTDFRMGTRASMPTPPTRRRRPPTFHPGVLQADSDMVTASGPMDSFNFNACRCLRPRPLRMTLHGGTRTGNGGQYTGGSQAIVAGTP